MTLDGIFQTNPSDELWPPGFQVQTASDWARICPLISALVLGSSWITFNTLKIQHLNYLVLGFISLWVAGLQSCSKFLHGQSMSTTWMKHIPVFQGTWNGLRHKTLDSVVPGWRRWATNGAWSSTELAWLFSNTWRITVLVVFYSLDDECPVLQQLSPGCSYQIVLNQNLFHQQEPICL